MAIGLLDFWQPARRHFWFGETAITRSTGGETWGAPIRWSLAADTHLLFPSGASNATDHSNLVCGGDCNDADRECRFWPTKRQRPRRIRVWRVWWSSQPSDHRG